MAFVIKNILGANTNLIEFRLCEALAKSRFNAVLKNDGTRVSIHKVRLNVAKDYCGNHPYACPVRPGGPRPHKKTKNLEGADWVAFNDMLNDVLDTLNVSANVASSLCIIRKGVARRTEYHGHTLGNGLDSEWNRDTETRFYIDRCGQKTGCSTYPKDTPGLDYWREGEKDSRGHVPHDH